MIESKQSTIEAPPSVTDITATDERVGTVDFSTQLGAPVAPAQDDAATALASMARPQRPADGDTEGDGPSLPFILPPARVDAVMAAEAERTRLETAAARGELPDDDLDDDLAQDDDDDPDSGSGSGSDEGDDTGDGDRTGHDGTGEPTDEPGPAVPVKKRRTRLGRKNEVEEPPAPDPVEETPAKPSGPPEGLLIQAVADLDVVAEEAAWQHEVKLSEQREERRVEAARRLVAEEILRSRAATDPDAELPPPSAADLLAAPSSVDDVQAHQPLALEAPAVLSVQQVADEVIHAMRAVNVAHELHVESLELETARRCELLTAQAELDAELIRLHARREAHAIIAAARSRSGASDPTLVEPDQLGEIGETFSRFAETIETTVAPGPGSPDHLRKS